MASSAHLFAQVVAEATPTTSPGSGSESTPAGNSQYVQILLTILGPAGILGSIIALLRFKSEDSSQVFTQNQGVTAEWKGIADGRKQEIADQKVEIANLQLKISTMEADHNRQTRDLEQEIAELRQQLASRNPTA